MSAIPSSIGLTCELSREGAYQSSSSQWATSAKGQGGSEGHRNPRPRGFFVTNATIHLELTRDSDLSYALVSPIDGTGVPITLKWLGTSGGGAKRTAEFQIHLPPNGVAITGSEGQNLLNFDVAATAFLDHGKNTHPAAASKTVTGSLTGAQMAVLRAQGISVQNTLELGPGQYTVRVVVRDNATGKIGSVTAPLTVN